MNRMTLSSRAILHLSRYMHIPPDVEYCAPFEITQDGVGSALGITRAYASVLLNRMESRGLVTHGMSKIRNSSSPVKRKVYFLTEKGKKEFKGIEGMLKESGMDVDDLYFISNLNRCSADVVESLSIEDRDLVGSLCLIRGIVHRSDVPREVPILQFDVRGNLLIKDEARKRFISQADEQTLGKWHSIAADWWMDHDNNMGERLYHLHSAGRMQESRKLVMKNKHRLMDTPDMESYGIVTDLSRKFDDEELRLIGATMALNLRLLDDAENIASTIECDSVRNTVLAETDLMRGRTSSALDLALNAYVGDALTGLVLGMCMESVERYGEAMIFLGKSKESMIRDRCLFRLEDLLCCEASCHKAFGDTRMAERKMELAMRLCVSDSKRDMLRSRYGTAGT